MPIVLIISARGEYHAERIAELCRERSIDVLRLHSDDEIELRNFHLSLLEEAKVHVRSPANRLGRDVQNVLGIFYSYPLEADLSPQSRQYLFSIYDFLEGCNWVNEPGKTAQAWNKIIMYQAAVRAGLRVPLTLFSNAFDKTHLQLFAAGEILYKPLLQPFTSGEEGSFASKVDGGVLLQNQEQLRLCPQTFQQYVDKRAEIFVFVVGARVFAVSVSSRTLAHEVDFRQNDVLNCAYEIHQLPTSIEAKCLWLVHEGLGLQAANLDFALDAQGEYHLLDCNPYEKWGFLEERLGLPIAQSYVDIIVQKSFFPLTFVAKEP